MDELEELKKEVTGVLVAAVRTSLEVALDKHFKLEERRLELYEKRTMMIEKIAMALEYQNERKFHTV
jgi:hypothetical protein